MNAPSDCPAAQLRRCVYGLLAAASVGLMLGRILAVDSVNVRDLERYRAQKMPDELLQARSGLVKQGLPSGEVEKRMRAVEAEYADRLRLRRPFLSANDRSRWCTVRALVEEAMRVEGAPYAIDKVVREPNWDTIDMVKHDGRLYSSKPPLYSTLLAAQYWVIHRLTGATLGTHPYAIGRFLLVVNNVLPLVLYFWLLGALAERLGKTDWGRVFVVASAALGTFLTTFAVVINNHIPAAVCAMIALYAAVRIWLDGQRGWHWFALAGFFAAFAAADELPAMSLLAALAAALLWKAPAKTLAAFVPAALVVVAAFFVTNEIAHRSLRPPYLHRSTTNPADNWYAFEYERNGQTVLSYWHPQNRDKLGEIDKGEPSRAVYALHVLVGHHGIFSLTPVWVLSVVGLGIWLRRPDDRRLRELAILIAAVSLACLVFYVGVVGQKDRNYGGMTSGLRWVFWLAPLWLVAMLPAADAASGRRWARWLALALLAASALSAAYPTWNPWTHPWIYDFLQYLGWIR
jgi:hypothetical protein